MFDDLLIHTVEVRPRSGLKDRLDQPVEPKRSDPPEFTYACRLTTGDPSESFNERERDTVASSHKLFVPIGAQIYEADRVTVKDKTGKVLVDFANVTGVMKPSGFFGPHHVEVKLDATRTGERP